MNRAPVNQAKRIADELIAGGQADELVAAVNSADPGSTQPLTVSGAGAPDRQVTVTYDRVPAEENT